MMMPGEQIRLLRKEKGITQEQLAEAMNVSVAAVSKWETGQSAPELSLLCEIADYFAVSVDALLRHEVRREQLDALLHALNDARQNRDAEALRALVAKTLQGYPNIYEAVDACADACYALFVQHGDKEALEQSILLTHRLLELGKHLGGMKEIELHASLANQYELAENWERALYYHEKCNLNGHGDYNIARCRLNHDQPEAALTAISDHLQEEAFTLYRKVNTLCEIHTALHQPDKAMAALHWGVRVIAGLGENAFLSSLLFLMQISLFTMYRDAGNRDAAIQAIREASRHAAIADSDDRQLPEYTFLRVSSRREQLRSYASCHELLALIAGESEYREFCR